MTTSASQGRSLREPLFLVHKKTLAKISAATSRGSGLRRHHRGILPPAAAPAAGSHLLPPTLNSGWGSDTLALQSYDIVALLPQVHYT